MLNSESPLEAGYIYAMGVAPDLETLNTLEPLYRDAKAYYTERESAVITLAGDQGSAELAALIVVANAILNLDQFIMKA